ncbi:unnamed protein product [Prunus armeniaca]
MVEAAENRSAFANTCRKSSTTSQYPRRKSPLTSSDEPSIGNRNVTTLRRLADTCPPCTGEPKRSHLPLAPTLRRFDFSIPLLFETTTFLANGRHALVLLSLTPRAERQAHMGLVFTHPSCRTAGTHGSIFNHLSCRTAGTHESSFHSPLMSNGRHAWVLFSLTSRAKRQARMGLVFTHLSYRTAGPLTHPLSVVHPPSALSAAPFQSSNQPLGLRTWGTT